MQEGRVIKTLFPFVNKVLYNTNRYITILFLDRLHTWDCDYPQLNESAFGKLHIHFTSDTYFFFIINSFCIVTE